MATWKQEFHAVVWYLYQNCYITATCENDPVKLQYFLHMIWHYASTKNKETPLRHHNASHQVVNYGVFSLIVILKFITNIFSKLELNSNTMVADVKRAAIFGYRATSYRKTSKMKSTKSMAWSLVSVIINGILTRWYRIMRIPFCVKLGGL